MHTTTVHDSDEARRVRVRRALDVLKPYLTTFADQRLSAALGARRPERQDISAVLGAILEHWEPVFARHLSRTVRHYLHELRDIRNRWAHEEHFEDEEVRRAVDTAALVAKAIGAPPAVVNEIRLVAGGALPHASIAPPPAAPPAPKPTRAPGDINDPEVIVDVAGLDAGDVVMKRVLCPACGEKVFDMWPLGWDAHSAHSCPGVEGDTEEERKADFRSRFAHLFRDGGTGGLVPRSQRDVMRRIYVECRADEARAAREYAAAELRGEVRRARNRYGMSAEEYARRLLADGLKKGWLPVTRP